MRFTHSPALGGFGASGGRSGRRNLGRSVVKKPSSQALASDHRVASSVSAEFIAHSSWGKVSFVLWLCQSSPRVSERWLFSCPMKADFRTLSLVVPRSFPGGTWPHGCCSWIVAAGPPGASSSGVAWGSPVWGNLGAKSARGQKASQVREFAEQRERGRKSLRFMRLQPGPLHQARPENDSALCDTFVQERQAAWWSRVCVLELDCLDFSTPVSLSVKCLPRHVVLRNWVNDTKCWEQCLANVKWYVSLW